MDKSVTTPFSYLSKLGSAVISGITGGAAGAALGPMGLVTMFFQVMFSGIAAAEAKGKMHSMAMAWQADNIEKGFEYNQLQEEYAKLQIKQDAETAFAEQESAIYQAELIHFTLVVLVVVLVYAILFFIFPRKK